MKSTMKNETEVERGKKNFLIPPPKVHSLFFIALSLKTAKSWSKLVRKKAKCYEKWNMNFWCQKGFPHCRHSLRGWPPAPRGGWPCYWEIEREKKIFLIPPPKVHSLFFIASSLKIIQVLVKVGQKKWKVLWKMSIKFL